MLVLQLSQYIIIVIYCGCPACMCVCVWEVKDQREFGINVRKEKVKRVRGVGRHQ